MNFEIIFQKHKILDKLGIAKIIVDTFIDTYLSIIHSAKSSDFEAL